MPASVKGAGIQQPATAVKQRQTCSLCLWSPRSCGVISFSKQDDRGPGRKGGPHNPHRVMADPSRMKASSQLGQALPWLPAGTFPVNAYLYHHPGYPSHLLPGSPTMAYGLQEEACLLSVWFTLKPKCLDQCPLCSWCAINICWVKDSPENLLLLQWTASKLLQIPLKIFFELCICKYLKLSAKLQ